MKKLVLFLAMITLFFTTTTIADAHPGRLDSNGGHNCSDKSKAKGLCTGYHYHNGNSGSGSSSGGQSSYTQPTKAIQAPALTKVAVYLNNVKQSYTPSAYMKNGTTLVPMKPIFEALGATVSYDNATKKVTATKVGRKSLSGLATKQLMLMQMERHLQLALATLPKFTKERQWCLYALLVKPLAQR